MTSTLRITMLVLASAVGTLAGCASTARYDHRALHGETFTVNSPQAVLDSPLVHQARQARTGGFDPGTAAWWDRRNDAYLNVRRNQPRGETVFYVIHTENRLQSFGNRTFDVHRQITYSSRYGRIDR